MDGHRSLFLFLSMPAETSESQGSGAGACAWSSEQDSWHLAIPPQAELCQPTKPQVFRAQDLSKPGCGSLKTKPQLSLLPVQECLASEVCCQSQGQSQPAEMVKGSPSCSGLGARDVLSLPLWLLPFLLPLQPASRGQEAFTLEGNIQGKQDASALGNSTGTRDVPQHGHIWSCAPTPPWQWGSGAQPEPGWECRDFAAFRVQPLDTGPLQRPHCRVRSSPLPLLVPAASPE